MVSFGTLRLLSGLLSLVALCFLLCSVLLLIAVNPIKTFLTVWQRFAAKCKSLNFAWPGAGVRTKGQEIEAHQALQLLRVIGPNLVLAVIFFGIGYLWRDHQLANNRVTYTAVYVAKKLSNEDFVMQPARMQPIRSSLCYSRVDWRQGETLQDWTFEQLHGCKRVISYHRYPKGELNARN